MEPNDSVLLLQLVVTLANLLDALVLFAGSGKSDVNIGARQ